MIDNKFRMWLAPNSNKIISFYRWIGITPNKVTFLSLVLSFCAAYTCFLGLNLITILLWWIGRFFDGTDGILARETNQATSFGAYLDILCDMASYSVIIIGFFYRFSLFSHLWVIIFFLYILCITSALSLGHLQEKLLLNINDNRGLKLGVGLIEGGETGVAYSLFLLFPGHLKIMLYIWILLLLITILARTFFAYRVLNLKS